MLDSSTPHGDALGLTFDPPIPMMGGLPSRLAALGLALDAPWAAVHWEGAVADPPDWVLWLSRWLPDASAVYSQAYAIDPAIWQENWQGFAFELLGVAAPDVTAAPAAPILDWLISPTGEAEAVVWYHPPEDLDAPDRRLRIQILEQRAWGSGGDLVA